MFTGIIECIGQVETCEKKDADGRFAIKATELDLTNVTLGDSIAVSGVCLTVVTKTESTFLVDVSAETLSCTTLGELQTGDAVNLEQAVTPTTRLGGHLVSGHVDGVGAVTALTEDGCSIKMMIAVPPSLAKYIAVKGSVCVDGVSLTVNSIEKNSFSVNIIPHTLEKTTTGLYREGQRVNIEVDVVARYLERLLNAESNDSITHEFLTEHGYLR